uniref:DUF3778 domain-containing protein n=1 Tax=Oryza meridionalis TaxID=40149 RepID=A0A0E0BY92_9ORYZ
MDLKSAYAENEGRGWEPEVMDEYKQQFRDLVFPVPVAMSRLVTFKRRALVAGGDDCRSWSCDLKDRIFFLCWCRTRWSALCADDGCLGSPDGAASYSDGGGPGSLGAGALCGGSGLEIFGDVAPSDNLGSPSVAALCGSLQTPGAVASCDSLGALRTTAPCASYTLSCCFSAMVKTLCGCGISFLQSEGYFFVGSLLLFICCALLQFYNPAAILGLLQRQKFYRNHLISHVMWTTCSTESCFLLLQNNSIHAGSIIRVEQSLLLRSNERLHGTNLLSPYVKRCACQWRPKDSIVVALPQNSVDLIPYCCFVSSETHSPPRGQLVASVDACGPSDADRIFPLRFTARETRSRENINSTDLMDLSLYQP